METMRAVCLVLLAALAAVPLAGCTTDPQTIAERDRARLKEIQRLHEIQDNYAR